jgi:N-acetylmuramoyl-L-alanine amidase
MQLIKRGDSGPAAHEVRQTLVTLGLLAPAAEGATDVDHALFDTACELALREFQQSRGMMVDGIVGQETWRALVAARWQLGDRVLMRSIGEPTVGDDVRALQERLLEMGYDAGRADGVFGQRTERALIVFQRECGLIGDGTFGPGTMRALRRLGRKVVGGRPQLLREAEILHHAGPALVGKRIVIDPGHGGNDHGSAVIDGPMHWSESELVYDLAARLEGRLVATGVRVDLTRGRDTWYSDAERAAFANATGADLLISLHIDSHRNADANGVAVYHFGTGSGATSTAGERLAGLALREIVARTGLHDCRTHAKTWDLLRLTRMPAVRIEVGYLTCPDDRAKLIDPMFRDQVADAVVAAVQRVFFASDSEVETGTLDVSALRAAVGAGS